MPREEWISVAVDGSAMRAHLSLPDDALANGCGVVVLHGVGGIESGFLALPKRLAELGYTVIFPDLFHRYPYFQARPRTERVSNLTWEGVQADLDGALAVLRAHGVRHSAVLGYCFGGALVLMASAALPFETGVMYYPHSLFMPFGTGPEAAADLISHVRVPVLGHFGADDRNPSPADMQRLEAELTAAGVPHRLFAYAGAAHGFAVSGDGRDNFRETQSIAANQRTVDWFERELLARALR